MLPYVVLTGYTADGLRSGLLTGIKMKLLLGRDQ